MNPSFLELDEILRIHEDQIRRHGGDLSVRDRGLLISAISMPKATFGGQFLHCDIYEMAAAYIFHIVQNHPFVDGNKRTGAVAGIVFLDMNGLELRAKNEELIELILATARGQTKKPEIAEFLRRRCKRRGTKAKS